MHGRGAHAQTLHSAAFARRRRPTAADAAPTAFSPSLPSFTKGGAHDVQRRRDPQQRPLPRKVCVRSFFFAAVRARVLAFLRCRSQKPTQTQQTQNKKQKHRRLWLLADVAGQRAKNVDHRRHSRRALLSRCALAAVRCVVRFVVVLCVCWVHAVRAPTLTHRTRTHTRAHAPLTAFLMVINVVVIFVKLLAG